MSPWMHPLPVFERESRQEIGSIIVNEPSDTTGQEAVLDSVHHVIVTRPNIQNCLHGNLDLEGSDRSILQLHGLLLESTPSVAYAPGDLNGQIDVVVNCYTLHGSSFRRVCLLPSSTAGEVHLPKGEVVGYR